MCPRLPEGLLSGQGSEGISFPFTFLARKNYHRKFKFSGPYPIRFEECVTEDPVVLRCAVEIPDSLLPFFFCDQALPVCCITNTFDHCSKRQSGKSLDKCGAGSIDIHHTGRDLYVTKPGINEKRIQLPSDEGITPCIPLEMDKTVNGFLCIPAVRMEKCRAVIAFNNSYCPTFF